MKDNKSHEENVRSVYNSLKSMGLHDRAEEYKQEQKMLSRMLGRKDPFSNTGCLLIFIIFSTILINYVLWFPMKEKSVN